MKKAKSDLRHTLLEKRNALSEKQIRQWSMKIKEQLYSLPQFQNAKSCMIYVSKGSEVYTHDIVEENIRKKRISVPTTTKTKIIPSVINFFDELKVGMYGILEPKKIIEMPIKEIEAVVVPCVGVDEKGNRIGYGKGYFDKLLRWIPGPKIGLAFEMQISKEVPRDKSDIPLDIVVTEQRVIKVKR